MFLTFQNGEKNIQTAGYNGARTVYRILAASKIFFWKKNFIQIAIKFR